LFYKREKTLKLNKLLTGYQITDEVINRTSSAALPLEHDTIRFVAADFEIWTGAGKTGTKLTLTTDYVLAGENETFTTESGVPIYTTLAIVNGAYQNIDIYGTYKTIGDFASVDNVREAAREPLQLRYKTAAEWTAENPILAIAELGAELVTGKVKCGDGVTAWNSLNYCLTPLSSTPSAGKVMVWKDNGWDYKDFTLVIPAGGVFASVAHGLSDSSIRDFVGVFTGTHGVRLKTNTVSPGTTNDTLIYIDVYNGSVRILPISTIASVYVGQTMFIRVWYLP
jgi:hypothetical protein